MDVKETLGNVKETVEGFMKNEDLKGKVKDVLDKTDIDEKIVEKVKDIAGNVTGKKN